MIGLMLKDLFVMRKYARSLLLIVAFYIVFAFTTDMSPAFINGMIILMCAMTAVSSFSYDDLAKWDRYALTMPVTRNQVVLSKYGLGIGLGFAGCVLSLACNGVLAALHRNVGTFTEQLLVCYVLFAVACLYISIVIPAIYKFGVEKSRIIMIAAFAVPTIGAFLLKQAGVQMPSADTLMTLLQISPVVLILLVFLSFLLSGHIYSRTEF